MSDRLVELIEGVFQDSSDELPLRLLDEYLVANPAAVDEYLGYCSLHCELMKLLALPGSIRPVRGPAG